MLEINLDESGIIRGETETEQGFIEEVCGLEEVVIDPEVTDVELVVIAADTTEASQVEEVVTDADITGESGVEGILTDPSVKE